MIQQTEMTPMEYIIVRYGRGYGFPDHCIEIQNKERFDLAGYSFLEYNENVSMEEWVETHNLENYKNSMKRVER